MKATNNYVFFWQGAFSNFYPCEITYFNNLFHSSEQLFMCMKAALFKDHEMVEAILHAKDAKEAKALGRKIKNFDSILWDKTKETLMYIAVCAKFDNNPKLLVELLKYPTQTFVEASPYDKIWGVGLSEDDPDILDPDNWQGENLLGKILTRIRDENLK